jgi:hypothetical protein
MSRALYPILLLSLALPSIAQAEDTRGSKGAGPVEILEDEKIDVEADLPSVEFVMNFKGLKYESLENPESFIKEILNSVEKDPF